jgi:hypothetical protein
LSYGDGSTSIIETAGAARKNGTPIRRGCEKGTLGVIKKFAFPASNRPLFFLNILGLPIRGAILACVFVLFL